MGSMSNQIDKPYNGNLACPRGKVGDVEWEFNHDIIFSTAAEICCLYAGVEQSGGKSKIRI